MPQKVLAGRYSILRQLGGGGFGQTYLARDQHLPGKPFCVVKKLQPKIKSPEAWEASKRLFEAEAEVLHALGHHEQIPHLTAHFEEDRQFYLVQEYIPGLVLNQSFKSSLPLSEADTIALLYEILELLVFVHQHQVIHRDIKPSNLIRRESDQKIVLIDFGAVKQLTLSSIEDPSIIVGSSGYAPPEQLAGCSCFESDLYAVGMIGIQALTGYSPKNLQRDKHSKALFWRDQAEVSPAFADLLDRLIAYEANDRYPSAQAVLAALDQLSNDEPSGEDSGSVAWTERGDYLLQRQHFREAIAAYDRALHLHPEDASLWMKQGMAYDGIQQFEAAIAAYEQATLYAPEQAQVWLKLGVLLENLDRLEAALNVYARVVELEPDNVWAWHDRGKILETLGQVEDAIYAYSKAIAIKPNFQLAVESRKRLLLDRNDLMGLLQSSHYAEALMLSKRAHQEDPKNPQILLIYGTALTRLHRYDEAIEILNTLLMTEPDQIQAWHLRSEIHSQQRNWEQALQDVERSIDLDPDQGTSWHLKANILEAIGNWDEAIEACNRILSIDPSELSAQEQRNRCLRQLSPAPPLLKLDDTEEDSTILSIPTLPQGLGSDGRGAAALQQASTRHVTSPAAKSTAAKIAAKLDQCDTTAALIEAINPEQPAIATPNLLSALAASKAKATLGSARSTDQTGSWLLRGSLLTKVRQQARQLPSAVSETIPLNQTEALKQRGDTLFGLGRYEDAINHYDRAIHLTPNHPKLWCSLASALMKLKRYREAIACFDRAIHLKPESHIPWYWRGRVLIELKRYPEALRSLERALENKPNFQPALHAKSALRRAIDNAASLN